MALCGKHRGVVVENRDPQLLGRLRVQVPSVLGEAAPFALPAVPYAGPQVGFLALPPIGANVWVEFENCDIDRPIWTGCFWGAGEMPAPAAADVTAKVLKTDQVSLVVSDLPGSQGIVIEVGGMKLVLRNNTVDIVNAASSIHMTPSEVSINNGALSVI